MIKIFSYGVWVIMFILFLITAIIKAISIIKIPNKNQFIITCKKILYILLAVIRGISCVYLVINEKVDDGNFQSGVYYGYKGFAYRETITSRVFEGFSGTCMVLMLVFMIISLFLIIKIVLSKKEDNTIAMFFCIITRILIYIVGIAMFSYESNHFSWFPILIGVIDLITTSVGLYILDEYFLIELIDYSDEVYKSLKVKKCKYCNKTMNFNDDYCSYCGAKQSITNNVQNKKRVYISSDGIKRCGYCNSEMKDSTYCYNCGKYNKA